MNGRQTASSIFRRQYLLGCWELLRGTIHSLPRAKDVLFSVAFGPFINDHLLYKLCVKAEMIEIPPL